MTSTPDDAEQAQRAREVAEAKAAAAQAALEAATAAKTAADLGGVDYLPLKISDYYNSRYSEYMSQYRFFGSLRTRIAWAPATISVAVVAFLFEQFATSTVVLSVVIAVIFLAIFVVNLALQREQIIHLRLGSECDKVVQLAIQEKTTAAFLGKISGTILDGYLNAAMPVLPTHKQMRTEVRKKFHLGYYFQEVATWALLVFLFALGITAVAITNQIDFNLESLRPIGGGVPDGS